MWSDSGRGEVDIRDDEDTIGALSLVTVEVGRADSVAGFLRKRTGVVSLSRTVPRVVVEGGD